MEKNWYESEADDGRGSWYASVPAPTYVPPEKKHNGWKIACGILSVLLLIALSGYLFRGDASEEAPIEGSDSGFALPWNSGEGEGSGDGNQENSGLPGGFSDNFMDFFDNYYTSIEQAEECNIPRVEAPKSLGIELKEPEGEALTLPGIYEKCSPFIVAISAYPDPKNDSRYSWGTGIILSSDGYIVTNSHVVEGACRAKVTLQDDREFDALLVGNDSRSDIAVLKIDARGLTAAEFASCESLRVGEDVVALGNPLSDSFRCTMTNGIITGIGRDISYNGTTLNLIQTNAAINEGNSGGALINAYGQVIGITNMKMSNTYAGAVTIEGVGFAIPSDTVKSMADALLTDGVVLGRPALGITVGAIPEEAAEHYELPEGLYVSAIADGSDAKNRDIRVGDVITMANGGPVAVTDDLVQLIADLTVGDSLTLTIFRDGKTFDVEVKLVDVTDVY